MTPNQQFTENKILCGSRTCKPNSPGRIVNKQVIDSETAGTVNKVNVGSAGRFSVTPVSHSARGFGQRDQNTALISRTFSDAIKVG
jgi:hypothetical protein